MADEQPADVPAPLPSAYVPASNPTVVPAQDAKTYDRWWLARVLIEAPSDNVYGSFTLRKYCVLKDGTIEFSPVDDPVEFRIDDILSRTDVSIQQAIGALLAAVQGIGAKLNLL